VALPAGHRPVLPRLQAAFEAAVTDNALAST